MLASLATVMLALQLGLPALDTHGVFVMRTSSIIVVVAILGCRGPAPPPATEAARIRAEVDRIGPDTVALRMDRDDALGERMLDSISSGDSTWLQVAAALRATGNVGIAEALPISVAEALPKAPEQVLSLIQRKQFAIDEVCNIPFIEPPDSLVAAYYARTTAALGHVTRADLLIVRDQCQAALERVHRIGAPAL